MVMIFETSIQVYAANGENLQELAPLEISTGQNFVFFDIVA